MKYNPGKIERKWQEYWEAKNLYRAKDTVAKRRNFMLLTEFPYPSGNLHIGHWYAFALPDILGRYLRMNGHNVMYPIGFDAFGLPAENAAIKNKTHPEIWTKKNIAYMSKQLRSMGAAFDWSRTVSTIEPKYYKWTQWMFLKFFEKGLAYRKKTLANWCPKDKTILANEQVIYTPTANSQQPTGCCERCGTPVEQRELEQWMFRTTAFADALADGIGEMDWPEATKLAQKNWIGRSEGSLVKFQIPNSKFQIQSLEVFTTRADTLFGCTYVVISPEVAKKWIDEGWNAGHAVRNYITQCLLRQELERMAEQKEKTGFDTGVRAVNPANGEEVPVYVADYVLGHYGTGAVMAVPAHDERDFEFAKKFNLPIRKVIQPPRIVPEPIPGQAVPDLNIVSECWEGEGEMVNSGDFNGMTSMEARRAIIVWLAEKGMGRAVRQYRLHDWILSRQRFWGTPIPLIYCRKCAEVPISNNQFPKNNEANIIVRDGIRFAIIPVPERELPVKLPPLKNFKPTDSGQSPLARVKNWMNVKCPKCKGPAERETDTMDTFVDSSWYFIRYADPKNKRTFADKKKMQAWLPVPMYVGGAEHNTMHLLYSRFFTKALHSLGLVDFDEPFTGRRNHGVILGPDSQKMSKSRGNVVDPDVEVKKYGADAVRMYLAFMGPYEQGGPWDPGGINGVHRFLNRVSRLFLSAKFKDQNEKLQSKIQNDQTVNYVLHGAIKKIGNDIADLRFNTGVSELMKLLNEFESCVAGGGQLSVGSYQLFVKLLAPFAPHLAEELWTGVLRHTTSVHLESWPEYSEELLVQQLIDIPVQVNGKVRDVLKVVPDISEEKIREMAFASEAVKRNIEGRTVKKVIYVPQRMVSIVVSD